MNYEKWETMFIDCLKEVYKTNKHNVNLKKENSELRAKLRNAKLTKEINEPQEELDRIKYKKPHLYLVKS